MGAEVCQDYVRALQAYTQHTAAGQIPLPKYVDLPAAWRLLGGTGDVARVIGGALIGAAWITIAAAWWRWGSRAGRQQSLLWALTLSGGLLFNLYTPIYDVSVMCIASLLLAEAMYHRYAAIGARTTPGFVALLIALIAASWLSQPLARWTGLQVMTPVLLAFFLYALALLRAAPALADRKDSPELAHV